MNTLTGNLSPLQMIGDRQTGTIAHNEDSYEVEGINGFCLLHAAGKGCLAEKNAIMSPKESLPLIRNPVGVDGDLRQP